MSHTISVTKEIILLQLRETSLEISKKIDSAYQVDIEAIAEELSISFGIVSGIINREDQSTVSDNDFQSALLFWTV